MPITVVQIIPAQDWFFVHEGHKPQQLVAHRIAAWVLDSAGETTGLIGGIQTGPGTQCESNRLVGVPPVKGTYKHLNDLTVNEQIAAGLSEQWPAS